METTAAVTTTGGCAGCWNSTLKNTGKFFEITWSEYLKPLAVKIGDVFSRTVKGIFLWIKLNPIQTRNILIACVTGCIGGIACLVIFRCCCCPTNHEAPITDDRAARFLANRPATLPHIEHVDAQGVTTIWPPQVLPQMPAAQPPVASSVSAPATVVSAVVGRPISSSSSRESLEEIFQPPQGSSSASHPPMLSQEGSSSGVNSLLPVPPQSDSIEAVIVSAAIGSAVSAAAGSSVIGLNADSSSVVSEAVVNG